MNRTDLMKAILKKAKCDKRNRRDPRYTQTMGFLVAKGFLKTNQPIPLLPNKRIHIADAIWAGKNVEPRILEVLPAAILRLPRHFDLEPTGHPALYATVASLKKQEDKGEPLWGVAYDKIKVWVHLPLFDRRMKEITERKITKTFRFSPIVIQRLKEQSKKWDCTGTEVLERILLAL